MSSSTATSRRALTTHVPTFAVDLGLNGDPRPARPDDPAAVQVRAKLDEQVRALVAHDAVARQGEDPEGVHQMRVAVRRMRAAIKADGSGFGDAAERLQTELRWLGSMLGAVRDLDVQLDHLRGQAAHFEPDEQAAVDRLLLGLRADRRKARQRMLRALKTKRYRDLLETLVTAIHSEPSAAGDAPGRNRPAAGMIELIRRPYRKLSKAATALSDDPPDDDLHELRIHGKRLRYAAELAEPAGGKPVRRLIAATKGLQDVLGEHQDAVVAEQEIRRLLDELGDVVDVDVVFAAGRLVERERARRADCRARWRAALATVDTHAETVLAD